MRTVPWIARSYRNGVLKSAFSRQQHTLHPDRTHALSGSNWRMAFYRVMNVPYGPNAEWAKVRHFYEEMFDEVRNVSPEPAKELDDDSGK